MKTFALINMKGGVGKTTTAINLSYLLATEHQQRVLLIDADGQANATRALLPSADEGGLAWLLSGLVCSYDEAVVPTDIPGLDMIPASDALWRIDLDAATGGSAAGVYRALRALRDAVEGNGSPAKTSEMLFA